MKNLALLLACFILVFSVCAKAEKDMSSSDNSPPAPGFTALDLDGNEISLSDYEGKVIFLNFWATWCPPCRAEIPGFVEVYDKYKNKGMQIIGVSLDRTGKDKVLDFAHEYKINYPVVMGTRKLVNDYRPGRFIPSTIIIGQDGNIREKHVGYLDKQTMEKYFLELTSEK
ncbi:MAG: TlpA family protein disulfide reductase [Candidatus Aminicenantes bacterium]